METWKGERSVGYSGEEWVRGRLLGKGSFGRVNLAYFPNPKMPQFQGMPAVAAVKSTPSARAADLAFEKQILDYFQDCPFIVSCLGDDVTYTDDDELVYNVFLELASGGTLCDLIAESEGSGIPESQASRITKSILGGLRRIHEQGMVHCDIKLSNVLLVKEDGDFVAKIADFGLAQSVEEDFIQRGTYQYWAPEIVVDEIQGQASDIWALGCVVFAMLTGTRPWDDYSSLSQDAFMEIIGVESPHLPTGLLSDSAIHFLCECFQRDPQRRPTAAMLLDHPFLAGAGDHYNNLLSVEYPSSIFTQDDEDDHSGADDAETSLCSLTMIMDMVSLKSQPDEPFCLISAC